jgi:hypothetical protein
VKRDKHAVVLDPPQILLAHTEAVTVGGVAVGRAIAEMVLNPE